MPKADLRSRWPVPTGTPWPLSFRDYVLGRKYDFGRGSAASWTFIAFARGDANFPEIATGPELQAYLAQAEVPSGLAAAATSVWRSYTALRSRKGRILYPRGQSDGQT